MLMAFITAAHSESTVVAIAVNAASTIAATPSNAARPTGIQSSKSVSAVQPSSARTGPSIAAPAAPAARCPTNSLRLLIVSPFRCDSTPDWPELQINIWIQALPTVAKVQGCLLGRVFSLCLLTCRLPGQGSDYDLFDLTRPVLNPWLTRNGI